MRNTRKLVLNKKLSTIQTLFFDFRFLDLLSVGKKGFVRRVIGEFSETGLQWRKTNYTVRILE